VSKTHSKEKIEKSIDGILGNLIIRGRDTDQRDKEIQDLKQKLELYEQFGPLDELKKEKEELIQTVISLKKEKDQLEHSINRIKTEVGSTRDKKEISSVIQDISLYDKDKHAYQPSTIICQYCEQPEGKRKLTIHLREIEYQAILKASHHLHTSKGQLMDTITRALRFYISKGYYIEAEREVSFKAIHSVRSVLEGLGFSQEEIEKRIKRI